MPKRVAKTFEEYKAPWELDSEDKPVAEDAQQLDPVKLKKYLWNLIEDKVRGQEAVTKVTTERDELQVKVDELARKGESDAEKVQREHAEALAKAKKEGQSEGDRAHLALEVALEVPGITPKQAKLLAKKLTGQTREELAADAESTAEAFGLVVKDGDDDGDTVASRPVSRRPPASGDPDPVKTSRLPAIDDTAAINAIFKRH